MVTWNFKDFFKSEFVCKHCGQLPEIAEVNYYGLVMYFLQPLRSDIGVPIYIHSGYRCPDYNSSLPNSAVKSYHTITYPVRNYKPCAVDIWSDINYPHLLDYINKHADLNFCGYHLYFDWRGLYFIHIDFRGFKARW